MTLIRHAVRKKIKSACRCDMCGDIIQVGERHVVQTYVLEDHWVTWRNHQVCQDWFEALVRHAGGYYDDGIDQFSLVDALKQEEGYLGQ